MSAGLPDIGHVATSQVDGLAIRLARGGRSDGVPLLLTSPWPESIYAYRAIWPEIKALGPLIAVDQPGFGRSEGRADLMSPEAMGDFVVKLAQHFGIDRMHAVGPDVGSSALLFAAVRTPSLFESLVVGSGAMSTELAAGGLKDIIEAPIGAFDNVEGGEVAVQFVTQSAAVAIRSLPLRRDRRVKRIPSAANWSRSVPVWPRCRVRRDVSNRRNAARRQHREDLCRER
jgi:pimeloyl-ACP methyl ester carboxylesterase